MTRASILVKIANHFYVNPYICLEKKTTNREQSSDKSEVDIFFPVFCFCFGK